VSLLTGSLIRLVYRQARREGTMAKILLIEDDPHLAVSIKEQLESLKHIVEHVIE
jgi:hypothetical protein